MIQFRFFITFIINIIVLLKGCPAAMPILNSSPIQTIYVYSGPGTSPVAIKHTEYTLKRLLRPCYHIQQIGPDQVKEGNWTKNASLFVMPGGIDVPYSRALNQRGNEQIITYVQNGGAYLGICAGAYYASKRIEFGVGTQHEVIKDRELGFFPGHSQGPLLKPWDSRTNAGAQAALLHWKGPESAFKSSQPFTVYFNGGGHFAEAKTYPNVKVLATYANSQPKMDAIVEVAVGRGRVILSGVHCEFAPEHFDLKDAYLAPVQNELLPHDHMRQALMAYLLNRLHLQTISL